VSHDIHVRFCKRHIRHIQALAGNLPIHSRSWLQGPDVARWFGVIGYVVVFSLANFVSHKPREITVTVPPDKFLKQPH